MSVPCYAKLCCNEHQKAGVVVNFTELHDFLYSDSLFGCIPEREGLQTLVSRPLIYGPLNWKPRNIQHTGIPVH